MRAGVIEGLVGAHSNMRIADIPFQIYHGEERKAKHSILNQAEDAGKTANFPAMERAGEYMTKLTERAYQYKDIAEDQLKKEMEEKRKNEDLQREEELKKQREENQKFYKTLKEKQAEKAAANTDAKARNNQSSKTSAIKKIEPTETKAYGAGGQAVTAVPKKPVFATTI